MLPTVVGFTGTHGTGKTLLLQQIEALNLPGVAVDKFSVPRAVQAGYWSGMTLDEIVSDHARVVKLQNKINTLMGLHIASMATALDDAVLIDRSPVDFYSYAKLWVEQLITSGLDRDRATVLEQWLATYLQDCLFQLHGKYDFLFVLPPGDFAFENQPNRGSLSSRDRHHQIILETLQDVRIPYEVVQVQDLGARVAQVKAWLEKQKL